MRSKKTYQEYNRDPSVRFPRLQWMLDRKTPYIVFATVSLLALGFVFKAGWDSYSRSIQEPQSVSPYMELISAESPGMLWAQELVSRNPAGFTEWAVSESTKPNSVVNDQICAGLTQHPTSLLATRSASGANVNTSVQVYGAGQAYRQFETYHALFSDCFGELPIERVNNSSFFKFPGGFIITTGDGIVGVTGPDETIDVVFDFYIVAFEETLTASECAALPVRTEDAKRSFFYNKDEYAGLRSSTTLESKVDISGLPTPSSLNVAKIEIDSMEIPEAPLPEGFPKLPKEVVTEPAIPAPPADESAFTAVADYQIADDQGPGCGWAWSAQKSPVYDRAALEDERDYTIRSTQDSVNERAKGYVKTKVDWALQTASIAPSLNKWNSYASTVNSTHERWIWLNDQRNALQPLWEEYVFLHDDWSTFDSRKATAKKEYDDAVKKCEAEEKALEDWKDKWEDIVKEREKEKEEEEKNKSTTKPTPSPTPTPTPTPSPSATKEPEIPPMPEGCDTPPEEPAILSMEKPAEPKAPEIPAGVTIPQSWPTPK